MNTKNNSAVFNPIFILSRSDCAFIIVLVIALVITSRANYLLFHSLVEMAIITTGFLSFTFAWHLRRFELGPLLPIGIVLGCTSFISVFHMLSFKGMGVLGNDANLPTQFWIASRYFFSIVVLGTLWFSKAKINPIKFLVIFVVITIVLLIMVFSNWFPDCYITGVGQTSFKIISEYIIALIFIISMTLFWNNRKAFPERVTWLIMYFFSFSILTELVFTSYLGVYDLSNMLGHIFYLTASYFLYKAIVETGLKNPFELMFKNLNDAVNARDEFISIASHELKTPLTPLKLHLQVFQKELQKETVNGQLESKALKAIRSTNEIINRLTQLIDGMLDVSRLSTGRFEIYKVPTDLTELLSVIAKGFESQIIAANSKLILKLEPVSIEVDPLRMEQVFTNLIMNAIKYAPACTIEIGIEKNTETGLTLIWVSDTGPGIPKEHQERIFKRYERGMSQSAIGGLGLGLYIGRQIIEAHGGTLSLESEANKGAKFIIKL